MFELDGVRGDLTVIELRSGAIIYLQSRSRRQTQIGHMYFTACKETE